VKAALTLLLLCCNGCLAARIVYYNTPTLSAASSFDSRPVHASHSPVPLLRSAGEIKFRLTNAERARYDTFDAFLAAQQTRAFLVIHDDRVVYERYFHGVSQTTQLPGFSMSKTFAAALVGRAVSQGLLASLDQPVVRDIPEKYFDKSSMKSLD